MIKEAIDNVLNEMGVNDLQGDDRYEVAAALADHFQTVLIDTVMANLDMEQLEEFQRLAELDDPQKMDEGIASLVAQIPGINFKIEEALELEMETLKKAKSVMDA